MKIFKKWNEVESYVDLDRADTIREIGISEGENPKDTIGDRAYDRACMEQRRQYER